VLEARAGGVFPDSLVWRDTIVGATTRYMRVMDLTGAKLASVAALAGTEGVELVWPHTGAAPGVYLYRVSTPVGATTGKIAVVR
jgi:hypothetical protein